MIFALTVASGQNVSSAFTPNAAARALSIEVPSMTATEVRLQFSTATTGPWRDLVRPDGTGVPFTVFSGVGGGWCVVERPASTFARLFTVSSQADVRSIGVSEVIR